MSRRREHNAQLHPLAGRKSLHPPASLWKGFAFIITLPAFLTVMAEGAARAACTEMHEVRAFRKSLSRTLKCMLTDLDAGTRSGCETPPPPPCSGNLLEEVVHLAMGTGPYSQTDGKAVRAQFQCQRAIARATGRFLWRRAKELLRGERRQRSSRLALLSVLHHCSVDVVQDPGGTVLPSVGSPCSEVSPPAGNILEPGSVTQCLRPTLERAATSLVGGGPIRPNIVVVTTDDQRWDTLGFMPILTDRLASRGILFTNSFATTPICGPSRASFFTGHYMHNTGIWGNNPPAGGASVFDARSTIATWLHEAGYRTALFGKYMNGNAWLAPNVPPGWDDWHTFVEDSPLYYGYTLNENGELRHYGSSQAEYSTDLLAGMAAQFVTSNADVPFLMTYNPFAPHSPSTPAPRHVGALADLPPWRPPSWNEPDVSDKPGWLQYIYAAFHDPAVDLINDQQRRDQLETLLAVDEAIERILGALDSLGLTDNTVVLFTSDNGYAWGEHWEWGKEAAYEEQIRIPMILRYPVGHPLPRTETGFVLNIDVAPTLAELAGLAVPTTVDGQSMLRLLEGGTPWREDALIEHRLNFIVPTYAAVRTPEWKYILSENSDGTPQFEELYDMVNDPYELKNLAGEPARVDVLAALSVRLAELRAQ
jgi:N-acetylglucosamine-6-sulfatase